MADDDAEKIFSSSSSRPFTLQNGFPFVFLPSAFAEGFTFVNQSGDDASPADEQVTSESTEKKTTDDEDERDHNDDDTESKSDLRISQPKYSQLLKDLDFSKSRMVDVTDILSKNRDSPANYLSPDENEKYQSFSSNRQSDSSDESDEQPTATNDKNKDENFQNAAEEIQNDLNNLAAIIQAASQIQVDQSVEQKPNLTRKKSTFDEDDDTSKQATQNYDLHDFDQEDLPAASTKSSKIPQVVLQTCDDENSDSETSKNEEFPTETPITWNNLVLGEKATKDEINWENLVNGEQTKAESQPTPAEKPVEQFEKRFRRISDSSSSNTESVVDRDLFVVPPTIGQNIPTASIDPSASRNPPQPQRQDSQGTLIDENLDDLTSQWKQVLFDQERQTFNTSTKEERTTDGIGSMSIPLSTPDKLSTDILDNDDENLVETLRTRHISATQPFYESQYRSTGPTTFDLPQRLASTKKKTHHRHHHHRHSASRLIDRDHESNLRHSDDNWLNLLDKLEREHRSRLEKQQQQYENYMQDLEDKMQRRFDEYLTLTSGFQESRLNNYDDVSPLHRTHTTVPIDTNIGRYKTHSTHPSERPVVKDLISHYYPADSTLNILNSSGKRRTTGGTSNNSSHVRPRSLSKDELINVRAELSARHAQHLAELKSYEHEINEIKDQINRTKMGHASSVTRQSMDTIERINNENIRLQDEMTEIRHDLKLTQEENHLLKRQLEDLRGQIASKDSELKNYHRTIADLEQQLTQAENTKERRDEKFRHADRQALLYREENEKLKLDLNLSRDRLMRLEERYRELEAENDSLRRQMFKSEPENHRTTTRSTERSDFGRFPSSRDTTYETARFSTNGETFYRHHHHSPRPMTRITDYLNEKPIYPPAYIPPTTKTEDERKHLLFSSPRKSSTSPRRRYGTSKPTDQLESKFDLLLKRKRDLETRLSRIPTRNLTATDRQLFDVLEREISRVEQQISSVKLELRKLNVFPVH